MLRLRSAVVASRIHLLHLHRDFLFRLPLLITLQTLLTYYANPLHFYLIDDQEGYIYWSHMPKFQEPTGKSSSSSIENT